MSEIPRPHAGRRARLADRLRQRLPAFATLRRGLARARWIPANGGGRRVSPKRLAKAEALARRRAGLAVALARRRVPLGFVCGAAVLWLARPSARTLALGVAIALVGELLRIWAAGHLEKGREVTRSGPYRITRHPLYMGSAIIGVGAAVASARLSASVLIVVYFAATTLSAIRTEEAAMRASFGEQYDAYPKSLATPVDRAFNLTRAMKNKEHRAIVGLVVVAALLAVKIVFSSR